MDYILSLSYGKDSLACLGAIEQLGLPLTRIVHAEVWATDTIPADLPPMVEFKAKADEIIKQRWGIEVEHVCAMKDGEKLTYEKIFYRIPKRKPGGKFSGESVYGFPYQKGAWCNDRLKTNVLDDIARGGQYTASPSSEDNGAIRCSRPQPYGWATKWSLYCTGELKRQPLNSKTGFPKAPKRGAIKISCNTSASPQMNPTGSTTLPRLSVLRSLKRHGRKPCAASGAKKTTCSPRSTQRRRGGLLVLS